MKIKPKHCGHGRPMLDGRMVWPSLGLLTPAGRVVPETAFEGGHSRGAAGVGGAATSASDNVAGTAGGAPSASTAVTAARSVHTDSSSTLGAGDSDAGPSKGCVFVPAKSQSCPNCSVMGCQGECCCTAVAMPGGTYLVGRTEVRFDSDFYPGGEGSGMREHGASVSRPFLDKYEVTVGRSRQFVNNYDTRQLGHPGFGDRSNPSASDIGRGQSRTLLDSNPPLNAAKLKEMVVCKSQFET